MKLRLPIASLRGQVPNGFAAGLRTTNISAGGMYLRACGPAAPPTGAEVWFVLSVPPGQGHSAAGGRVVGSGHVVRSDAVGHQATGVAVAFARPLKLEF